MLQCDVRQFFPSIDHAILLNSLGRKIDDAQVLGLAERILASGEGVLSEAYTMVYFGGDDLFAVYRPRGLPIGNLTSQFWANCFLNPFDHFVKRELRCPGYVRYVDDFLLFADDKASLWAWLDASEKRSGAAAADHSPRRTSASEQGRRSISWFRQFSQCTTVEAAQGCPLSAASAPALGTMRAR